MIRLTIPKDRQVSTLTKCGYQLHPTTYNGMTEYGYVRNVSERNRWHAIMEGNTVDVHFDITKNGMHRVYKRAQWEKQERMRICRIYRELFPSSRKEGSPLHMHVGKKGVLAPNLKELQRRKTVLRKAWNPLRYIFGSIKVIKS